MLGPFHSGMRAGDEAKFMYLNKRAAQVRNETETAAAARVLGEEGEEEEAQARESSMQMSFGDGTTAELN